jgi:hypothetical protein
VTRRKALHREFLLVLLASKTQHIDVLCVCHFMAARWLFATC